VVVGASMPPAPRRDIQRFSGNALRRSRTGRGARYALTEKGLDLLPAMLDLMSWSARHDPRTAAPPAFVARIRRERQALTAELRAELRRRYRF
jgi:hypothetical protein